MDGFLWKKDEKMDGQMNRWTVSTLSLLFFDVVFSSSDDTDIPGNNVCV